MPVGGATALLQWHMPKGCTLSITQGRQMLGGKGPWCIRHPPDHAQLCSADGSHLSKVCAALVMPPPVLGPGPASHLPSIQYEPCPHAGPHAAPNPLSPSTPQLMEQELVPSLRKLEAQCAEYHEYAVTSQTHERLKRFCIAYEYSECLR